MLFANYNVFIAHYMAKKISTSLFVKKLENKWNENKFVCVGLDPVKEKLPQSITRKFKTGSYIDSIDRKWFITLCRKNHQHS